LTARVIFVSFGRIPTLVDLTFMIMNESGEVVYSGKDAVVVETEQVLSKKFEELDLPTGKYTLVFTTLYNVDVEDEFKQEFEIVKEAEIQKISIFQNTGIKNIVLLVIIVVLGIGLYRLLAQKGGPSERRSSRAGKKQKLLKNKLIQLILLSFFILLLAAQLVSIAFAASIPHRMTYGGKLLGNSGNPITTPHVIRLSLWKSTDWVTTDIDTEGAINTGASNYGNWQEEHIFTPNNQGVFSLELGSVTALTSITYELHRYLQVEVKAQGQPDTSYQLLDPTGDAGVDTVDRQTINSVAYAYTSQSAEYLQFGDTLARILFYDTDNNYFDFNDNVNIQGDLTLTGSVNGVDISNLQFIDLAPRVKEIMFTAEYAGFSLEEDGSDNRGKMEVENVDLGGVNKLNYYKWTTRQQTLQDIDIVLSYQLPLDFVSFSATPLTVTYRTNNDVAITNAVDVNLFDTTGTVVTLTGGNNLANVNWTTANITFTQSPTFTAGDTITLHMKLSSTNAGYAQISDIIFNYNGR